MKLEARRLRVRGIVQGVGFRPFIYRLALEHDLKGWVQNDAAGVEAQLEGSLKALEAFLVAIKHQTPPAARIEALKLETVALENFADFTIRQSSTLEPPSTRISPDIAVCDDCLIELFDPQNNRYQYPFINCTNCGPRYSIILELPYDRERTTMRDWKMCKDCEREYRDPRNRRFHAQPIACAKCGPHLELRQTEHILNGDMAAILETVKLLQHGEILAIKGIGGYHLACDARNTQAVQCLRMRKFRKEKPFAVMAANLETARSLIELTPESEVLLTSSARPIVLATAKLELGFVAPDAHELGVMLPYTPVHHLLFAHGAPEVLVMTSANRSNEPIAYLDEDGLQQLSGIADAFLIGQRGIARRVDDSLMRTSGVLRRARGLTPASVATLPTSEPILTVGADLKNTIALVVNGQVIVSQHIGDLEEVATFSAFEQTVGDLCKMHAIHLEDCLVAHDLHPAYRSTQFALELPARAHVPVQHHQAHIASVLAEQQAFDTRVLGIALDGTGYGSDGAIWGGEFFVGSLVEGFERVAHLENAVLIGGDAAARFPVQAAAGFLVALETPDLTLPPFDFPKRYNTALEMVRRNFQTHLTSSAGRLFDTVAALCGFTREITFEGQAAIWLEHLARQAKTVKPYTMHFNGRTLEHKGVLGCINQDRIRGRDVREIALAFHRGLANGLCQAAKVLCENHALETVVLSGGVMQNTLLLEMIRSKLLEHKLAVWVNQIVPTNDGGICLGQAAICAVSRNSS